MSSHGSADMTSGAISKQLAVFAMPIIMGNIFQQLYNTADAMIVGRMLGANAFAAVSVANPIMNVVLFFLVGLCMGISVLIAQRFGAKDYGALKIQLSTALIAGLVFTIVVSGLCIAFSNILLLAANTPAEIFKDTNRYLCIIFVGLIWSFLYNFFACALRAVGISRATFVFLVLAFLLNIVLDIIFIQFTPMGVAGAAVATVIAQAVAALLCIIYIYKAVPELALKKNEFIFKKEILWMTVAFSWAAALQQTVLYLGRMLIQGTINAYGTDMINGYNAALRIEGFVMAFIDGTAAALAAFAGQNIGGGTTVRLRKGLKKTVQLNVCFCAVLAAFFLLIPDVLVGMYLKDASEDTIRIGSDYIRYIALFYLPCATMSALQGFFRGIGKLKVTMIATMSQMVIRVGLSILLIPHFGVKGIVFSVVMGWVVLLAYDAYQYKKLDFLRRRHHE